MRLRSAFLRCVAGRQRAFQAVVSLVAGLRHTGQRRLAADKTCLANDRIVSAGQFGCRT